MTPENRSKKVAVLREEFTKAVAFHADGFRDIDDKAKYWITISLPSFVGLLGYTLQNAAVLSVHVIGVISSVCVCLLAAIYFLASTLRSVRVEGGVLLPGSPGSRSFDDASYFLETEDSWRELEEDWAREMLRAATANEHQNVRKAGNLKKAELLLFFGIPTATCLAALATFGYTSASPRGLGTATPAAAVAAGVVVGTAVAIALWSFAHFRASKA